jgi:UDP-N-acetylglucosamine 4-epimerase
MLSCEDLQETLRQRSQSWLVAGVAGFTVSNLLESLLRLNQCVVGSDNFATGYQHNLDEVQRLVTPAQWRNFRFILGDICELSDCYRASQSLEHVLHQAVLGSVPRSLAGPITTNHVNVTGFLNMLVASRDAGVKSFTYAASSSTYGDHPGLPKVEETLGNPLSPYAVTKMVNEFYAQTFALCFGFATIGLRYFNVFGPRQDPNGAYAAVIPKWIAALIRNEPLHINGDWNTSRDFCFVANAVQTNLLAATAEQQTALSQVYNIRVGDRTSLNTLAMLLREALHSCGVRSSRETIHRVFRFGDVSHSQADIGKARRLLCYVPWHNLAQGIAESIPWYMAQARAQRPAP